MKRKEKKRGEKKVKINHEDYSKRNSKNRRIEERLTVELTVNCGRACRRHDDR